MSTTAKLEVKDQNFIAAFAEFLSLVLQQEDIGAVLAPQQLPMKKMVMPVLITDYERIEGVDPFSPAYPLNGAKVVAKLTRKPMGAKVVAVMRPCEIRAFVELVKLKQARPEELIIISLDCFGAFRNTDFMRLTIDDPLQLSRDFTLKALGGGIEDPDGLKPASACNVCEHPIAAGADINIGLVGTDIDKELLVMGQSEKGDQLLNRLELTAAEIPDQRAAAVSQWIDRRTALRDEMFAQTHAATGNLEKLSVYLAACVNCYNCRVACPVCYCKECVFVTDVFNHEPSQYLQWAVRKGAVKMPTDTVFYHLTRLAHMSTACVGCGQCSNACPNDIPVMELFRTIAHRTQQAFDYEAGRQIDEHPPLSEFRENEFEEVVGIEAN